MMWGQKKDLEEEEETKANCEGLEFVRGMRDPFWNLNSLSIKAVYWLKPK